MPIFLSQLWFRHVQLKASNCYEKVRKHWKPGKRFLKLSVYFIFRPYEIWTTKISLFTSFRNVGWKSQFSASKLKHYEFSQETGKSNEKCHLECKMFVMCWSGNNCRKLAPTTDKYTISYAVVSKMGKLEDIYPYSRIEVTIETLTCSIIFYNLWKCYLFSIYMYRKSVHGKKRPYEVNRTFM